MKHFYISGALGFVLLAGSLTTAQAQAQQARQAGERTGTPRMVAPQTGAPQSRLPQGDAAQWHAPQDFLHEEDTRDTRSPLAAKIVFGAKAQVGIIKYDAAYVNMTYPGGEVPGNRGLCADVVVRALRNAGYDLQYLIHEDRTRNLPLYPRTFGWGRRGPDPNSDHRVVPNQMFFFQRYGTPLPLDVTEDTINEWQPGDIVYWNTGSPLLHAGVVSNTFNEEGYPLVIHMLDDDCVESDSLLSWPIIGHFRFYGLQQPPVTPREQEFQDGDTDE